MTTLLELAKAHAAAEDNHDAHATVATFTEDCVYTIDTFGVSLRGRETATQNYAESWATWPDFRNTQMVWYDAGDDIWTRARVEFTHSREWNGIAPTGKKVSFWSAAHFPRAKDGLLLGEHVYMNGNDMLYQMGALPSANAFEIFNHIRKLEARIKELEQALSRR